MPKQCPTCEQIYPDFVDFCVADGHRLERARPDDDDTQVAFEEPTTSELAGVPQQNSYVPGRARLFPKVRGEMQPFGVEFYGDVVLGRFDPAVGAVDLDLTEMPGAEFIEARHARLTFEGGAWRVDDLSAENGVFVDRGRRIDGRSHIKSGQELALGNALFVFEADEPPDGK